nr:hypothetical protein [Aquitalea sp. FJL05]
MPEAVRPFQDFLDYAFELVADINGLNAHGVVFLVGLAAAADKTTVTELFYIDKQ